MNRRSGLKGNEREELSVDLEELGPGEERNMLAFLEREPVRNLRIIWALRRWGLFNLGLPEQGKYLGAHEGESLSGILFLNNMGLLRVAAPEFSRMALFERGLLLWGLPSLLVGPEDEVDTILSRFTSLESSLEHIEEELSMILEAGDFKPVRKKASLALLEDVDQLAELEKRMQLEMLNSRAADWVIRSQVLRAVEAGAASLVRRRGRVASKAEMEAITPSADELGGVFTLASYRGKGYAKACCSFLCSLSLQAGKSVRLETQRDNRAALALYSGLGFKPLWPHLAVRFKS
jgi:GNAT superfamily N-acetyltransferase